MAGGFPNRIRLPDRRLAVVEDLAWAGRVWSLGLGFDGAGRVREIFLDGAKPGSGIDALVADGCVALSLLLQHGVSAAELARHLGRESVERQAPAASILGAAAVAAAAVERDEGNAAAATYAAAEIAAALVAPGARP